MNEANRKLAFLEDNNFLLRKLRCSLFIKTKETDKLYLRVFLPDILILLFFSDYKVLGDLLFVSSNGIISLKCSCFTGFPLGAELH
jgi:hypothetical protein